MNSTEPGTEPATLPVFSHWVTPAEVAKSFGVGHLIVLGWVTQGVKVDRGRMRLKAVKLGGRWRIDPAAAAEFVQRMTRQALGEGDDVLPPPQSAARDRRRVQASMDRLKALGIGGEPAAAPKRTPPRRRSRQARA